MPAAAAARWGLVSMDEEVVETVRGKVGAKSQLLYMDHETARTLRTHPDRPKPRF